MKSVLILCFLTCPVRHDKPVLALGMAHAAIAYADTAKTLDVVKHGGYETNPIIRPFVHHPAAYYAVTTLEVVGSAVLADRMRRSHNFTRKLWWLPQTLQIGAHGWGLTYTFGHS